MNPNDIVKILTDNYTLSELEDRLGTRLEDIEDGLYSYVVDHYDEVTELFMEDLFI